jgi:DMSO/TMAO reductase YedYZ molybdopterin-dependent catalytic subunit
MYVTKGVGVSRRWNMSMGIGNVIKSPDTLRKDRIPPGQVLTTRWPVLHYGSVPKIHTSKWEFKIWGTVEKSRTLNFEEFQALPSVQVFSDIHCVTRWSKLDNLWTGPSTRVVRDLVKILPGANYVIVHGAGGFTTNLTAEDFFQEDVLFAMKYEKDPLTPEHGYPVRLVVPRLYFWKSAKWVTGLEFSEKDKPGFWEAAGYHNHGDPWNEERFGR